MGTLITVHDDNDSIELRIETSAREAGINACTDDDSSPDETPVRLSLTIAIDSERRARRHWSVAALGLTLEDTLADRPAHFIDYRESSELIQAAIDRLAPAWYGWAIDAECQLEAEALCGSDESAWLAALDERAVNVFGANNC